MQERLRIWHSVPNTDIEGGVQSMTKTVYNISFRCYFPGDKDNYCDHRAHITLKEIPKWIEAYHYTHPKVKCIVVRVYPNEAEGVQENG